MSKPRSCYSSGDRTCFEFSSSSRSAPPATVNGVYPRATYSPSLAPSLLKPDKGALILEEDTSYSPWYQRKPQIRARVITADGQVHLLESATLIDTASQQDDEDIFSDRRVLGGPLPAFAVVEWA